MSESSAWQTDPTYKEDSILIIGLEGRKGKTIYVSLKIVIPG